MNAVRSLGRTPLATAVRRHLSCSMRVCDTLARRSSATVAATLIVHTLIGEPSDSKWSSYLIPSPSVAIQEILDTRCVAKFPICLHTPVDSLTDAIGSPSTLGLCLD